MITKLRTGEGGSIPMALLVVIVLGGLLAALLSRTIAEGRSTRTDNEYATAVHAAEQGLDDVLYRLNNSLIPTSTAEDSGEVDGYAYTWRAVRQPDRSWEVSSLGEGPNGVRRTITATLRDNPIFDQALATHLGITFNGGNTADSYNSGLLPQVRCSTSANASCYGIVASNGNIDMGSSGPNTNYADRVHVHDMGNPLNNGADRCGPSNSVYCAAPFRRDYPDPLDIRGDVGLTRRMLDACEGTFTPWAASTYATGNGQNRAAVLRDSQFHRAPVEINGQQRTVLCASTLLFDVHTTVPTDLAPANGYLIVVRDRIQLEGAVKVNCAGCNGSYPTSPNMPKARLLQIFTLAQDQISGNNNVVAAVQMRQHAKFGGAIYAPDASCGNQQSNAQVEIYGALICATVLNQGGWQFHYDEDLAKGLTTEQFVLARWTEE